MAKKNKGTDMQSIAFPTVKPTRKLDLKPMRIVDESGKTLANGEFDEKSGMVYTGHMRMAGYVVKVDDHDVVRLGAKPEGTESTEPAAPAVQ